MPKYVGDIPQRSEDALRWRISKWLQGVIVESITLIVTSSALFIAGAFLSFRIYM